MNKETETDFEAVPNKRNRKGKGDKRGKDKRGKGKQPIDITSETKIPEEIKRVFTKKNRINK